MPRSIEQLNEEEKKRLKDFGIDEKFIVAGVTTPPSYISLQPLTRKTWDERQRPQKALNEVRKLTSPQRQTLMFNLGIEGNEEELRALVQGYISGMTFRKQQEKQQAEDYVKKKEKSKKQQQDLEWNLMLFAQHLNVKDIREKLDKVAELTPMDVLSPLLDKVTKRQLNLKLNEVEWNTLSNWLVAHIEKAKIQAVQTLDRKLERSGLLKKKSKPNYAI